MTMRVERSGCGDSEGGPLRDVDFETELSGNREVLRALKQLEYVDPETVMIYGFSMGGILAPLIANSKSLRGIVTYGTACISWFEGVVARQDVGRGEPRDRWSRSLLVSAHGRAQAGS